MSPRIVLPDGDDDMAALLRRHRPRLERFGELALYADGPQPEAEMLARIGDAEAVVLAWNLPVPVLRQAPNLRLVAFTGTGPANFVDLGQARSLGIAVTNTPHYGDIAVAEHALALTLAAARHVAAGDRLVRDGQWGIGQGVELAGKTAGLVGYGGIGARFARLLEAVGMDVLVWTRTPDPARLVSPAHRFASLDEVMTRSDLVSLHLALTGQTRGLITPRLLGLLRDGAIVINTARAELIAPGALEAELATGRITAGLDVFDQEPVDPASPLLSLPNVVLTPHHGYNTPESLDRMIDIVTANIENYFSGTPSNVVN
jgi:phosphoglycerate dehydrogenase-like enzyme